MKDWLEALGARAWIVRAWESDQFARFLDATYANHFGEIWLFNNDLRVISREETFRVLYRDRIAGRLNGQIDAVKVLVRRELADRVLGASGDRLVQKELLGNLKQIYDQNGVEGERRLSTFYFGSMGTAVMADELLSPEFHENTWIFYTHRGHLDLNAGVVMLRRTQHPFSVNSDGQHFGVVWMLKGERVIQKRLKDAFEAVFQNENNFRWAKVVNDGSFSIQLAEGVSAETERRRQKRRREPTTLGLALGDYVDVAIIAALDVEMEAWEDVLGLEVSETPLKLDPYKCAVLPTGRGDLKILLATINAMGGVPAAVCASDVLARWEPRRVILIGVSGCDPTDRELDLGDVGVGEKIIGYELAKVTDQGQEPRIATWFPDATFREAVARAKRKWNSRRAPFTLPNGKIEQRPDGRSSLPRIRRIVIGSGSKLNASKKEFKRIQAHYGKEIKALEMEADGVGYACDQYPHRPPLLVIKGFMDRCDQGTRKAKNKDEWKRFAAVAAAAFARDVLSEL